MWAMPQKVRDVLGLDNDAVMSDREIEELIRIAQEQVKQTLFTYHEETVGNNPNTGDSWNGSNTTFQTLSYPIMDTNYDFIVNGRDVIGDWISSTYLISTCSIAVTSAKYGLITVKQTSGAAIPSNALNVIVYYYSCHRNMTELQLENLTTYLAAHFAYLRLKTGTSISAVDLQNNWKILLKSPTTYLDNYYLLLEQVKQPTIRGV